jgi:hypothetical protein
MKKLAAAFLVTATFAAVPQSASAQVIAHPGFNHGGGHHGGFRHGGFNRGGFFGGFAFGGFFQQPQFHVQNWQLYGFIAPGPQQQWVRYYDDAYLVDRRGYIHDARRGVSWDRHGERWERDERGIPYYVGRGDYHPDRRDYREVEREGRWSSGWDYGSYGCERARPCAPGPRGGYAEDRYEERRYESDGRGSDRRYAEDEEYDERYDEDRGDERRYEDGRNVRVYAAPHGGASCGAGYACGSSGYGQGGYSTSYGHGSGYGYGASSGTVVVTETTVTPGQQIVTEEIIEEVIEDRAVRRHRAAPRRYVAPPRRHPAPRPAPRVMQPSGERG